MLDRSFVWVLALWHTTKNPMENHRTLSCTPSGTRLRYLKQAIVCSIFTFPLNPPLTKGDFVRVLAPEKHKTKRKTYRSSFPVPLDVLFSKEFQDDLMRIWNLRYLIPDPEIYNKDTSQPTFH